MKPILMILCFLFAFTAKGQLQLNLKQCREMAVETSKQLAIAGKEKEKAVYTRKSYRADFFPKLSGVGIGFYNQEKYSYSLNGGYLPTYTPGADGKLQPNLMLDPGTGKPVIGSDGKPVFNQYAFLPDIGIEVGMRGVYMAGVQLEQPLYMGGKIRAAHKMAKLGEMMADENIRLNHSEIIREADEAYWQLLRVQEQLLVARKYKEAVNELVKNLTNARQTGMATNNTLLKAQVKYNDAQLMVQKAENGRVLARMNLCRIAGLALQTEIHIADSLSEQIAPEILVLSDHISQRPDYGLLTKEVELSGKQIALTRSDFLPQFGVTAGYGYGGGLELNGKGDANGSFNAMASVEIPLFHWGEGRNKVKAAKASQEISQLKLEKSAELMTLEVTAARFNMKDAQTRIDMCRNALIQAKENLRVTKDQYEVGMENITNMLEAQAQWQEAWSQWIDAKTILKLSETDYLKAIGKLE